MLRNILFLLLGFISSIVAEAQYIFTEHNLPVTQSILSYSSIADAENRNLSITEVKNGTANLKFSHLKGNFGNLGFTSHNFWLKFDLKNNLNTDVFYYLKTAEPITDHVNLYTFNKQGKVNVQKSGDNINFEDRSVANGKTIFKIELKPGELIHAFLEVKNDGEKNSLPLTLISQQKLLETTYQEQLIMGVFTAYYL